HLGLPCVPYLRRSRRVGQQARLGGAARRDNARGAFEVDPAALPLPRGPLLLVDDVFTTGATSDACRHALLAAGASRVLVAVVAARAKRVPAEPPPREVDPPPGRPAGPGPHRRLGPAAARARPLSRFRG